MKTKPPWLLFQRFILVSLVAIISGASSAKAQTGNMSDATGPNTGEVTTNSSGNIMTLPANFGQSEQDVTNPAPADAVPMPSDTSTDMPAPNPAAMGADMGQPPQNQQNPNNNPPPQNNNQPPPAPQNNNQPPPAPQNNNQPPQNNQNPNNNPPPQNNQNPNNNPPPQNQQNQNNPPPQNQQNQNNPPPQNQQNQQNQNNPPPQNQQNQQNQNNPPPEQSGQNNASSTQEPPPPPPPPAAGPNNFAPRPAVAPINGGGLGSPPPPAIFSAYSQIVRSQLESGSEKKEILLALGGGIDAENLASSLQGILVNVSEAGWQVNLDKLETAIDNYNTFIEDSPPEFLLAPPIMLIAIRDELMLWKGLVENN